MVRLTVPPADVNAICATLTPELPAGHDLAFEGRVTQVTAAQVTLEVITTFTGDAGDRVVITQQESSMAQDMSIAPLEVGGTYLISADGGRVVACGQSGPASPELRAVYDQAFGG